MRSLSVLTILRQGDGPYLFELNQPPDEGQPLAQPRRPYADVHVERLNINHFNEKVRGLVEGSDRPSGGAAQTVSGRDAFVVVGKGLYDELLPRLTSDARDLREALRGVKTPLLVSTNIPEIPWELLHDGEEFLGLKYDMGRSLRARGPDWRASRPDEPWRCLLISNPTLDLPSAASEADAVSKGLEQAGIACDHLSGSAATFKAVLDRLTESRYDIIHYSGHIRCREGSREYGFVLHREEILSASTIANHGPAPSIAFLNGCKSGHVVQGLTEAFLVAGAQMVVGTLYDTPSGGAGAFAQKFYEVLLAGQSAGEAMRIARAGVKQDPACGAAWLCFVMYGDPRFSIDLKLDELDLALKEIGLNRKEFDSPAVAVLEQAFAFSRPAGAVGTSHLFAALVNGIEHVKERLAAKQVPHKALQEAFQRAFAAPDTETLGKGAMKFGSNAALMLQRAKAAAGSAKISELDLVSGFARGRAGGAWDILRCLGVKPRDLDPNPEPRKAVSRVGPVGQSDCSPASWAALLTAAAIADQGGREDIATMDLFRGMLANPAGPLGVALDRLGIAPKPPVNSPPQDVGGSGGAEGEAVSCSPNTGDILSRAKANAVLEGRPIEEADLLRCFVDTGGGAAGAWLRERGVTPRCLTSELFLAGGALDTGRFDESGQRALDASLAFAHQKEYPVVGRRHLLYGLLSVDGLFASRLRRQQADPDLLAELLHTGLPPGRAGQSAATPGWSSFSTDLVKVLCTAEDLSRRDRSPLIGEKHLVEAWLADGGGGAGQFLIKNGVRLKKLANGDGEQSRSGSDGR